jgi:F0F1-type ATP synthase membrane subunit c/vacuolar-type H+-ATPase subunit K
VAGPANLRINIFANAKQVGKELNKTKKKFDGFGKGLKIAGAGIGAAVGAGFAVIIDSVKKAAEEEEDIRRLQTAIEKAGGAFADSTPKIVAWVDEIKRSSTFTDDQLRPALANLTNATGDVAEAQGLLTTAMDLSVASGKPLETVSLAIGKASNGQTTALKKLFPELNTQANKNKTGAELLQILSNKYKGADTAATNTTKGGLKLFSESIDDLQEDLGTLLLPYLQKFTDWAASPDGKKTLEDIADVVEELAKAFIAVAGGIDDTIIGFKSIAAFFKSKEYSLWLDFVKFTNPAAYLALRGTRPDNPRPLSDLLNEVVNGVPVPRAPRQSKQRDERDSYRTNSTTVINISTIDPAAAGVAVRRAMNTDSTRRGNLRIGG